MKLYFYRDCANLLKVVSGARLGDLIKSGAVNKSTNIYLVDSPGGGESINTVLNLGGRSKHPATLIEFLRSEKKAGFMFASKSTIGGRELAGLKNIAGQPKVCIDKLKSYSSVSRAGQCIVTDVEDIRDLKEPKMLFSPLNAEAYLAGCAKTNSLTIKNYAAGGGFTDEFVSSQVPVPKVMLAAEHLLDRNKAKAEETVDA